MTLPTHLAGNHAQGLVANEPIAQFEIGSMRNFVYLVLDWKTRHAAVIDPQKDLTPVLSAIDAHGFKLERVILTHSHHDHVAGVPELAHIYPDLPISVHEADHHRLGKKLKLESVRDGDQLRVGDLLLEVMHTPGHSAGECCYHLSGLNPPYLLTGDTVFVRDCGRTDFPDGSNEQMFASLQRIKALPAATIILPGHHYTTECNSTIARELDSSPPFRCKSVEELGRLP